MIQKKQEEICGPDEKGVVLVVPVYAGNYFWKKVCLEIGLISSGEVWNILELDKPLLCPLFPAASSW